MEEGEEGFDADRGRFSVVMEGFDMVRWQETKGGLQVISIDL